MKLMIEQEQKKKVRKRVKKLIKEGKKKEARALACKVVSCKPANEQLKEKIDYYNKYITKDELKIEFEKVSEILKAIEKVLFKVPGKNFSPRVKIATALYTATPFTWDIVIKDIVRENMAIPSNLRKLLKHISKKNPKLRKEIFKYSTKAKNRIGYNAEGLETHQKLREQREREYWYKYDSEAKPFVKWAGGKRQLLYKMKHFFPTDFDTYFEPFVGGGAVFFNFYNYYKKKDFRFSAILNDINPELINCYKVIKDPELLEELISMLREHELQHSEKYYYSIRELDREPKKYEKLGQVEKAARFIYLNRTCYNGLYRVNSKGQFNVPVGKYVDPLIADIRTLRAAHKAFDKASIFCGDYIEVLKEYVMENDFIYLDPPYHPISLTSNFTQYSKDGFSESDQRKLAGVFYELDLKGCKVMMSNSYSDLILDLYSEFNIIEIDSNRAINSDPSKRGSVKEVLIMNDYKTRVKTLDKFTGV
jgi:DNA adenine methylase